MPRRRRHDKRRYTVTIDVLNASLAADAWEYFWGGAEEGRLAWEALRGELHTNLGTRPAPFWKYEPDVPAELRVLASPPDPPSSALKVQALRWLLNGGQDHLRPGETAAIVAELRYLQDHPESAPWDPV